MKIGIDIRTLMDAQYSGVSEYTLNLVKEILKLDSKNNYQFFYNCFGDCPNIPEFSGQNVKVVKYNYPNKVLNYLLSKIFNYPKIDQELGVDLFLMPHINFIGLSGEAKSIITIHDLSFFRYQEFFSVRKNFWHRMVKVKKLLKKFDVIVAVSENTKRDIVELCGVNSEKIKVIYSGIVREYRKINYQLSIINYQSNPNDKIFNLNVDESRLAEIKNKYNLPDKFILFLGTVEPRKNVDGIIRAYNQLRINTRLSDGQDYELGDVKLVIAGSQGWKSDNIFREWERSEFKDDIKFLGYVESDDKVYLYNLASVFVYPSFYEGFGLPPLEAMACGLPVVASFSSSLPEVVGEAALMVDPYRISEISLALEQILTNKQLRENLIAKSLEQAKKFSWEKTAEEYFGLFETTLSSMR